MKQPFSHTQREQVLAWLTDPGTQASIRARLLEIDPQDNKLVARYESFANEFFMMHGAFPDQLRWLLEDVQRLLGDQKR